MSVIFMKPLQIFKLGYVPPHISLFLAITVFFASLHESNFFYEPFRAILIIGISAVPVTGGIMLLNNANDVVEDRLKGRENILTEGQINPTYVIILASFFYIISNLYVVYISLSVKRYAFVPFLIFSLLTWWYSDKKIMKKITGVRLKEHYIGELLTYIVSFPAFVTAFWLIFNDLDYRGLTFIFAFTFLGMFYVSIKDIKDISSDRKAGLKTIASILGPNKLLKIGCWMLLPYYISFFMSVFVGILETIYLILVIPFTIFLHSSFIPFWSEDWKISVKIKSNIKVLIISTYTSLFFIAISALFVLLM